MKTFQNQRYLLWLLPPLLLYVVPLLMGYAWNSMFGPNDPLANFSPDRASPQTVRLDSQFDSQSP